MIYCFKKLKAIKKLYVFFVAYACSALIGGGITAWFFYKGGGLQIASIVVLCIVYFEPTFIILRRINLWTIKSRIKYSDMTICEKISYAPTVSAFKPRLDIYCLDNLMFVVVWGAFFWFAQVDIPRLLQENGADYTGFLIGIWTVLSLEILAVGQIILSSMKKHIVR